MKKQIYFSLLAVLAVSSCAKGSSSYIYSELAKAKQMPYGQERSDFYMDLIQHLDADRAAKTLRAGVKTDRLYSDVYTEAAWQRFHEKEYYKSLMLATLAVESDKTSWAAYNVLGSSLSLLKRNDDALEAFDKAVDLTKNKEEKAKIYRNRALTHSQMGSNEEALADFTAAIGLNSSAASFYASRANFYVEQTEYKKALSDINQAIKREKSNLDYMNIKAHICLLNNDLKNAQKTAAKVLKADPDNVDAQFYLAQAQQSNAR